MLFKIPSLNWTELLRNSYEYLFLLFPPSLYPGLSWITILHRFGISLCASTLVYRRIRLHPVILQEFWGISSAKTTIWSAWFSSMGKLYYITTIQRTLIGLSPDCIKIEDIYTRTTLLYHWQKTTSTYIVRLFYFKCQFMKYCRKYKQLAF